MKPAKTNQTYETMGIQRHQKTKVKLRVMNKFYIIETLVL
jgi:hypothetical protein